MTHDCRARITDLYRFLGPGSGDRCPVPQITEHLREVRLSTPCPQDAGVFGVHDERVSVAVGHGLDETGSADHTMTERARLGSAWVEHDLVFARDGFKLYRGEAGGPQDPEKVSARWRTLRNRLRLPEDFRIHDWRHSKVTNDLEAGENPVEVSANVRHHSPGYTMAKYGHSRKDGARKLAASGAGRLGLSSLV